MTLHPPKQKQVPSMKVPDLTHVESALKRHEEINWAELWRNVGTNSEVYDLVTKERQSVAIIQLAFYEATHDRNSRHTCMNMDLDTLREMVRLWKDKKGAWAR